MNCTSHFLNSLTLASLDLQLPPLRWYVFCGAYPVQLPNGLIVIVSADCYCYWGWAHSGFSVSFLVSSVRLPLQRALFRRILLLHIYIYITLNRLYSDFSTNRQSTSICLFIYLPPECQSRYPKRHPIALFVGSGFTDKMKCAISVKQFVFCVVSYVWRLS